MSFPWSMKVLASTLISVSLRMLSRIRSPLEKVFSWKCLVMSSIRVRLPEPGAPTITECRSCLHGPMAAKRGRECGDCWSPGWTPAAPAPPPLLPGIRGGAWKTRCFRGCHPGLRDGVEEGMCELNDWVKTFPLGGCKGGGDGKSEMKMKKQSVDPEVPLFTGEKGEEREGYSI